MTREEEIRARASNGNAYEPNLDDDEIYVIMQRDDVEYLLNELDKRNGIIKELRITLGEIAHLWKESAERAEENTKIKGRIGDWFKLLLESIGWGLFLGLIAFLFYRSILGAMFEFSTATVMFYAFSLFYRHLKRKW